MHALAQVYAGVLYGHVKQVLQEVLQPSSVSEPLALVGKGNYELIMVDIIVDQNLYHCHAM